MQCICDAGCLLAGDHRNFLIEVGDRRFLFEMHRWCGPIALNAAGDPASAQPGPRHRFWSAVTHWLQQGKQVGADGLCVWTTPAEPGVVQIAGRHYAVKGSSLAERWGK